MKAIRKFLGLSTVEQRLFVKSLFWLAAITLSLRIFSFRSLRRFLADRAQHPGGLPQNKLSTPVRLSWTVKVAARYVPGATCLPQALTVQLLYKQHGYPAELRIGVTKGVQGRLEAHAWVESQGEIVIGSVPELNRFYRLSSPAGEQL